MIMEITCYWSLEGIQHLNGLLATRDLDLIVYHLTMSRFPSFSIPDSTLTNLVHFGDCSQLMLLFIS